MNYCCEELEAALKEEVIETWGSEEGPKYVIVHHVELDEGDGYTSDDSTVMYIKYCPFCGEEINRL